MPFIQAITEEVDGADVAEATAAMAGADRAEASGNGSPLPDAAGGSLEASAGGRAEARAGSNVGWARGDGAGAEGVGIVVVHS